MILRIVRLLMRIYPRGYRSAYADEMVFVLRQTHAEQKGLISHLWFALREGMGLIWGGLLARRSVFLDQGRLRQRSRIAPMNGLPDEVQQAQALVDYAMDRMVRAIADKRFAHARRHSDEEREARRILLQLCQRHGLGDGGV
jgi:hypothetical protein